MSNPNPTAVAAANCLSGQKTFFQINFPATGDPELDAISGCLAVLAVQDTQTTTIPAATKARVCKYLMERFEKLAEEEDEKEKHRTRLGDFIGSGAGQPVPMSAPWQPTTTSGGAPYTPDMSTDQRRRMIKALQEGITNGAADWPIPK